MFIVLVKAKLDRVCPPDIATTRSHCNQQR